jgi:hypothetical protein
VRQPVGQVKIDDQTYDVWPIKLATVITLSLPASPEANGQTFGQQMEQSIAVLRELIPTLPEDTIRGLPMEAFNRLLAWARETAFGEVEKNSATPAEAPTMETIPSTSLG